MSIPLPNSSNLHVFAPRRRFHGGALLCLLTATLVHPGLHAQTARSATAGLAWRLSGTWRLEGQSSPLTNGDTVLPGSLLQPESSSSGNSIVVLLPDGQSFFFACSKADNCARGFRVPQLYRDPEPFAVDMLDRIRAALHHDAISRAVALADPRLPRDEVVTLLDSGKKAQLGGLVSKLADGRYTCDLQPLDSRLPTQRHVPVVKAGPTIPFVLPAPGLYELAFTDELNNPRIRIYVAALAPVQSSILESFHRAHRQIVEWNEAYRGWPAHELGWAYMESFFLDSTSGEGAKGTSAGVKERAGEKAAAAALNSTAEPVFVPPPGVFTTNQSVVLQCATPGCTIHFAMDGVQPLSVSPIYSAPISVKGTTLTIKAYASAPGATDSPVVTGIFRILP